MPRLLMDRIGYRFAPHDSVTEEEMLQLGCGPFWVDVTTARSIPFDRLYRACLSEICKSGGYDKGPDAFHELTKALSAFVEVDITPAGQVITRNKSIAHQATDPAAFRQFFDNALQAWRDHGYYEYLPPDLRAKLEDDDRRAA